MNDIQDEREEFETNLQKEYELKILHLETKYHLEKGEKNTLQFENEKLRQQLFLKDRELQHLQSITSGYSTAAGSVNDGSPTHAQIPIIPLIPNQSAHTNQTVITHHSRNSQISQISQMSQISQQSPKSRKSRKSRKSLKPTRSPDPSMTGSEPSSSSNTDTNSSESDSDNDSSDTDDDDDSYSSSNTASTVTTISDDDDEKEEKVSKNEGDKYTKDVINTVSKRVKKRTSKNKKISNKLNQKIAEQQPKGFWATLWSLFGPPELMCSCSDDNKK